MAYLGTTSTAPNTPVLAVQGLAFASSNVTGVVGLRVGSPRMWIYNSTELAAVLNSSTGYFGKDLTRLGVQVGDTLMHFGASVPALHMFISLTTGSSQVGLPTTSPMSTS